MKLLLPFDLTLAGSEFHTVSAATEKARDPPFFRFHPRNVKKVTTGLGHHLMGM